VFVFYEGELLGWADDYGTVRHPTRELPEPVRGLAETFVAAAMDLVAELGPAERRPWRESAAAAVRDYMHADPERCMPTCRVGCPCDGGMEDSATGAPDAAAEIVDIVAAHAPAAPNGETGV